MLKHTRAKKVLLLEWQHSDGNLAASCVNRRISPEILPDGGLLSDKINSLPDSRSKSTQTRR
jgi:hypothetical protein